MYCGKEMVSSLGYVGGNKSGVRDSQDAGNQLLGDGHKGWNQKDWKLCCPNCCPTLRIDMPSETIFKCMR